MEEGGPSVDEFRKDKMHNEMMKWMHEYEQYKKNYKWEKKKRSGIEEAAQGGRIGMAGGGAIFKFIARLFIKASNDIRQGKGKWKGLDQKQRIVQHDNLTKKVTEFQKTGNTEGLEVYFGVNPNEAFAAVSKKVKKTVPEVPGDTYLEALDKRIMDEMDITKSEMDNMSSTALDDLRRNADPIGMEQNLGEITPGRGVGDFADDPNFLIKFQKQYKNTKEWLFIQKYQT